MAGKERDPDVLRAEAKELLNRAKAIEERKFKHAGQQCMSIIRKTL